MTTPEDIALPAIAGHGHHGPSHGRAPVRGRLHAAGVEPHAAQGRPAGRAGRDRPCDTPTPRWPGRHRHQHAGKRPGGGRRAVRAGRGRRDAPRRSLSRHGLHPAARGTRPRGAPGRAGRRPPRRAGVRRPRRRGNGTLAIMAGGKAADFERALPVLPLRPRHARGPARQRPAHQAGQPDDRGHHHRRGGRSAAAVRSRAAPTWPRCGRPSPAASPTAASCSCTASAWWSATSRRARAWTCSSRTCATRWRPRGDRL
jgi:hypothetical protein